jgi:hypothetical protein
LGTQCDPATIFGALPSRYDQARRPDANLFTDIMSIPPSVARRAYQAALDGQDPNFFYVRRFVNPAGGPDQFVTVTCRLSGGGARVPFALTAVRLLFAEDRPLSFVEPGQKPPPLRAEIQFNGTGRLRGRWEVVFPGDDPPTEVDLLTEASLPLTERGLQRRYTQVARFNVLLPPTGRYVLPGPDPERLPSTAAGQYMVLLRVEVAADKEAVNDLASIGGGPALVEHGAVAGFPMPALRYFVGGAGTGPSVGDGAIRLTSPDDAWSQDAFQPLALRWVDQPGAVMSRVEMAGPDEQVVLSALLPAGFRVYRPPSWLRERLGGMPLRWRVAALGADGQPLAETAWRTVNWKEE